MSFSNSLDDKNTLSSVPDFDKAVQISHEDALRLQIAALPNKEDRRACIARLAYAEEHTKLAEGRRQLLEDHYVSKHLKLETSLELTLGADDRSYEERKRALRAQFVRTPDGIEAQRQTDARTHELWQAVRDRLARAQGQRADEAVSKDTFKEQRNVPPLSHRFNRAVDR